MANPARVGETLPDGTLVLDTPVTLPEILDLLIVGGGPFGTAAAFRAKELGLSALVIDFDDLLKRIRDYTTDKPILPDFGGGDRMQFPKGGDLIGALRFDAIDKDEMCARWKTLYRRHNVPAQIGVELTGLRRDGNDWKAVVWNHNTKSEHVFRARHVVLAVGRGVPRRLDIPGNVAGLAFSLSSPARYVGEPACVIGGGISAAEAVIAISKEKARARDSSAVYWSYRGEKIPKVPKSLAEVFFDAFVGNGNVRYLPNSEPMAVLEHAGAAFLSIRTARVASPHQPIETTQLEFRKAFCVACIGDDVPEALLTHVGVPLVTGGASNTKRIVVTPLLETRQADVYLAGDVLSPAYFETTDFSADPASFAELNRRGNIKSALRDGVLVAEVIAQKLAGRTRIEVNLEYDQVASTRVAPTKPAAAKPAAAAAAAPAATCALVSILAGGVPANEYRLKPNGTTRIGRVSTEIVFADDTMMADVHASIVAGSDGYKVRDEGSSQGVYFQPARDRVVAVAPGTVVRAGRQWLVLGDARRPATVVHYDTRGERLGEYALREGVTIVGRQSPDLTISPEDAALSRRHVAITNRGGRLSLKDLGSANGTLVRVASPMPLQDGDRILVAQQVLEFSDESARAQPSSSIKHDTSFERRRKEPEPRPAGDAAARGVSSRTIPPAAVPPPPAAAAAAGGPSVLFQPLGRRAVCESGQTICEAAERAGIKIDADCHRGICGMDPVKVVAGAEHLNPLTGKERDTLEDLCSLEPGPYRLACMARVSGPVTVDVVKQ